MEPLYNRDILNPDAASFLDRLRASSLDDASIENEMVSVMEEMISSLDNIRAETNSSVLMMNMFSEDALSLNRKYISTTNTPSIVSSRIELSPDSRGNISGVVSTGNAIATYGQYFWRVGNNVDIKNKAFSTRGLIDYLDVMLTYDIGKSIFLGKSPSEVLDECFVPARSGSINSGNILPTEVICFSDMSRTYHEHNSTIDINVNSIVTEHSSLSGDILLTKSSSLLIKNLSSLTVASGLIDDESINTYFLGNNMLLADEAIAPDEKSNIASIEYVSVYMAENNAPKIGWKQENVTRDGDIDNAEIVALSRSILHGDQVPEKNRPTIFGDINSILESVGNEILGMEMCV